MKENDKTHVKYVVINEDYQNQRIDNFLLNHLKGVPRSFVYRILRSGEVRVNKGRVKPLYKIQVGDRIRIPPVRTAIQYQSSKPKQANCIAIEQSIVFEDSNLMIINKPSGQAVHGGSGISHGVIETLRHSRADTDYLELAHRLDRETSGLLILAKKRSILKVLHEALRNNQIEKHYYALIAGKWPRKTQRIDAPLSKNVLSSGERIVTVNDNGKAALTIIRPLCLGSNASLVDIKIETGRTHQIRVHTAYSKHPIAGDQKYGDDAFNRQMKSLGLNRLFLQAFSLKCNLPLESQNNLIIDLQIPLDSKLEAIITSLGLRHHNV